MRPLAERFGLRVVQEVADDSYTAVLYRRDQVGLRVAVDWSEFRPFLTIYELGPEGFVRGESGLLRADGRRTAFDVDDLLLLRAPPASPVGKMLGRRDEKAAGKLLGQYAQVLQDAGADVLAGRFDVFDQLNEVVKKREQRLT